MTASAGGVGGADVGPGVAGAELAVGPIVRVGVAGFGVAAVGDAGGIVGGTVA